MMLLMGIRCESSTEQWIQLNNWMWAEVKRDGQMGPKQAKKGDVCQILEESKWLRKRAAGAGSGYFRLYSCPGFMVLSPCLSLFSPLRPDLRWLLGSSQPSSQSAERLLAYLQMNKWKTSLNLKYEWFVVSYKANMRNRHRNMIPFMWKPSHFATLNT